MVSADRPYDNRRQAGQLLGAQLAHRPVAVDLVLGLPRGGVVVAAEVAEALHADLDVAVVRKIGAPGRPELGVGAIAEDERPVFDDDGLTALGLTIADLAHTVGAEITELRRRAHRYRDHQPALAIAGRRVLVVDDGLATGVTARAALRWLRSRGPTWLGFATPVGPADGPRLLAADADFVHCAWCPSGFRAVGEHYRDFTQTTDDEVTALLRRPVGAR